MNRENVETLRLGILNSPCGSGFQTLADSGWIDKNPFREAHSQRNVFAARAVQMTIVNPSTPTLPR